MAEGDLHEDFRRVRHPFEGRLVRLRPMELEDLPRINELFNDPDVQAGLVAAFPQSMPSVEEFHARQRRDESGIGFLIETLEGETVGSCALREIELRNRYGDLGIFIGKPYWRRGYGTDATRTLCRFGFRHMNLQRIELHVYETNTWGIRAYEKVGFKEEGRLRRAQFLGGRYVDTIVMGCLVEEFVDD